MFNKEYLDKIDDGKHRKEVLDYFQSFNLEEQDYYFCLRFIFFCWHVVNCGESIEYQSLENIRDKENPIHVLDTVIDGISCKYLQRVSFEVEDIIVKKFLCTNPEYDALLMQLINVFFYFFRQGTQDVKESVIRIDMLKKPESVIVRKMYDKLINGHGDFVLTDDEKQEVLNFFPGKSYFCGYFKYLFINDYDETQE